MKNVDKSIYLLLNEVIEYRISVPNDQIITTEESLQLFYFIMMLSYETVTTILQDRLSYNVYSKDVLLCSYDVIILVFKTVEKVDSYYYIKIFDLLRLSEYDIELDLKSFLSRFDVQNQHHSYEHLTCLVQSHNFEMNKCLRKFEYVVGQRQESLVKILYDYTFMECFNKFESTFEWKKHENLVYFQSEYWKYVFCSSSISSLDDRTYKCESKDVSGQM